MNLYMQNWQKKKKLKFLKTLTNINRYGKIT